MSAERNFGMPDSVRTMIAGLEYSEKTKLLISERQKASAFLQETIFPSRIKNLAKERNSGFGLASPYDIWEDISFESAFLDLFWNIKPVNFVIDDDGMKEVYSASAISIEMLPTGIAVLRGSDIGGIVLKPEEWIKNGALQANALNRVLRTPKADVHYAVDVNMPPYYD